ncbi:MAG TPA: hypothetical protein VMV94_17250 [Phycisphaerae bacterium]|nr:hypothetical protein [Phycisphaerae bacterium]
MTIDLTSDQLSIVRDLLEERIADLGPEIHHARTPEYHQTLKSLRETLMQLDAKLGAATEEIAA